MIENNTSRSFKYQLKNPMVITEEYIRLEPKSLSLIILMIFLSTILREFLNGILLALFIELIILWYILFGTCKAFHIYIREKKYEDKEILENES